MVTLVDGFFLIKQGVQIPVERLKIRTCGIPIFQKQLHVVRKLSIHIIIQMFEHFVRKISLNFSECKYKL